MKALLLAALLLLTLAAPSPATTCANLPVGVPDVPRFITPACTWIVAQVDPGVWIDQLGQVWTFPPCQNGVCSSAPVKVQLEDLHIGR